MSRRRPLDAPTFVGRDGALELITSVLWPARGAAARSVVVAGQAGVGKTRLAEEIAATAHRRGGAVATVRVTPAMAGLNLGPLATLVPMADQQLDRRVDLLIGVADSLLSEPHRLIVIDDAHLLDPVSAAALHLAMDRGPLRAVLTLRTSERADDAVVSMWKDGLAERVDLEPFGRVETERFAASLLGAPLDGMSANDLWESSRGNALFARELLVGALDQGLLVRHGDVHRFTSKPRTTARLAELLGARLAELDAVELEALDVLAVAGVLGLDQLRSTVGDDVVGRLEDRGLLLISTDGRRIPVRLVHPLYEELLRERMGRVREMAVHRLLAEQLEAVGVRRSTDVLDLARWRLVCGGETRPDVIMSAARQALARFDARLAGDLANLARASGDSPDADLVEAQAFAQQGRHQEAAEVFTRALGAASTDQEIVWAATELSVIRFWSLRDEETAIATVREAQARLVDPARVRQLEAHTCTFVAMANRPSEALELAAPHLEAGSGPEYLVAAVAIGPVLTVVGRALDALELTDRCLPQRLEIGDEAAIPDAFKYTISKVLALSEAGMLDDASTLATETYELAAAVRAVAGVAWAAMLRGRVALIAGDLTTAATLLAEAAELFIELGEPGLRSWSLAGTVLAAAMAGDDLRASVRLAELDAVDPGPVRLMQADLDRARAWALRSTGDVRGARVLLGRSIDDAERIGAFGMGLAMVHDLVRFGDRSAVGRLRREYRAVQGDLAAARVAMVEAFGSSDGDDLDRCADQFAQLGAFAFAAEAAAAAAAAHERTGSRRRAAASGGRSAEWKRRCPSLATPLVVGPTHAVTRLTDREREIAELASAGMSSRAIADQLGRSVRTIENHLQRVYEKLGIDGRGALASALGRLLAPPGAEGRI